MIMKHLISFITVYIVSMAVFSMLLFPLVEMIDSLYAVAIASAGAVTSMVFTHSLFKKAIV